MNNDKDANARSRFWGREIDGQPLGRWAAMGVVPFCLGLLAESRGHGDAVLPGTLLLLIALGGYFLWRSVR